MRDSSLSGKPLLSLRNTRIVADREGHPDTSGLTVHQGGGIRGAIRSGQIHHDLNGGPGHTVICTATHSDVDVSGQVASIRTTVSYGDKGSVGGYNKRGNAEVLASRIARFKERNSDRRGRLSEDRYTYQSRCQQQQRCKR